MSLLENYVVVRTYYQQPSSTTCKFLCLVLSEVQQYSVCVSTLKTAVWCWCLPYYYYYSCDCCACIIPLLLLLLLQRIKYFSYYDDLLLNKEESWCLVVVSCLFGWIRGKIAITFSFLLQEMTTITIVFSVLTVSEKNYQEIKINCRSYLLLL